MHEQSWKLDLENGNMFLKGNLLLWTEQERSIPWCYGRSCLGVIWEGVGCSALQGVEGFRCWAIVCEGGLLEVDWVLSIE